MNADDRPILDVLLIAQIVYYRTIDNSMIKQSEKVNCNTKTTVRQIKAVKNVNQNLTPNNFRFLK